MLVFSVNADGVVGFYKLRANEDGTQQELQPNRAYLSLPLLPQSTATASYAISVRSIDADLSGIKVPGSDDIFNDAPAEYFTIDGRAVAEPAKGHIYIVRQGKKVSKIVY